MTDCVFSLDRTQMAEFGKISYGHSSCWCSNSRISESTAFTSCNRISAGTFFHDKCFQSACCDIRSLLWCPQKPKLPKVRFVVIFPYSQTRFFPKLRSKVSLDNFIFPENDSKIYLCFGSLFRNPEELIMPTNAKNNGRTVICGKFLKTKFETLKKVDDKTLQLVRKICCR